MTRRPWNCRRILRSLFEGHVRAFFRGEGPFREVFSTPVTPIERDPFLLASITPPSPPRPVPGSAAFWVHFK